MAPTTDYTYINSTCPLSDIVYIPIVFGCVGYQTMKFCTPQNFKSHPAKLGNEHIFLRSHSKI